MNKDITFKANFSVSPNGQKNSGYLSLKPGMYNIKKFFIEDTEDEQNYDLKLMNLSMFDKDTFLLKKNSEEQSFIKAPFCRDLKKMDDREATKRLTRIFKAMKYKSEQDKLLAKKIAEKNELIAQKEDEIKKLEQTQKEEFEVLLKKLGLN